jgi:MFS family permease
MSRGQRLTLFAAILGSAVATVDGSIVNVALPAIERDLGGGLQAQQWVANAYLLTLGSLIPRSSWCASPLLRQRTVRAAPSTTSARSSARWG